MSAALLMLVLSTAPMPPAPGGGASVEMRPLKVKHVPRPRFVQRRVTPPPGVDGTPLVLVFDGGRAELTDDGGAFELEPGVAMRSAWPKAATPWLCRDLDGDGRITSGRELFGSFTRLGDGLARDGFEALAALDDNGDGVIDARDEAFGALCVWRDENGNRRTDPGEPQSLREAGVEALSVRPLVQRRCGEGFCEVERAPLLTAQGVGAVIDVHLVLRPACGESPAVADAQPRPSTR